VKLRQMATCFLFNDNNVLMMKRNLNHIIPQEVWTCVGGHIEPSEVNNPEAACIREIYEETGIAQNEIYDLSLRYIIIRQKDREIRQQYVFFGKTHKTEIQSNEEGDLYWINESELLGLELSEIIKHLINHYYEHRELTEVFTGTMTLNKSGKPETMWTILIDPGIF
jgi:8-oxo-dGTP diphosphatase